MVSREKSSGKKRYVERPDVRKTLLDAAEAVVREEGYGAATARRIASRGGMKHQAVFYYFGSQDDLMLALLRRFTDVHRKRLNEALDADNPMRAMWDIIRDPDSMKIGLEFMALANHNEVIRVEIASNSEEIRALEAEAIARYLDERGIKPLLSPEVVSILTNAVARLLVQEATLGIHSGHEEVERLVERSFGNFEAWGEANAEVMPIVSAMSSSD